MAGRFFDVAVITEGINGLIAAYELSKSDVSIVVIDNYKPSLDIDGYIFNYYPEHVFAYNELPEILKELPVTFETYINPMYQLILPDRRVDIYSDIQKLMAAVELRFDRDEASVLTEYLDKEKRLCELLPGLSRQVGYGIKIAGSVLRRLRLKQLLLKEKQSANESFRRIAEHDRSRVFINAIVRYLLPWVDDNRAFQGTCIAPLVIGKRFYPAGGMDSIKTALIKELQQRNVNIVQDKEVNSIDYEKYFTITFDHEQSVRSRSIVSEPLYEKTLSLLPFDYSKIIKKQFYVDNIFVGLHRSCLPEIYDRVNNAVMVSDYNRPLANDNIIFIDSNPVSDIKRAKDEMAALTITMPIKENSISKISSIRQSVIERVKWFMPFFDEYVEHIYYTEPSILWNNTDAPVYRKGIMLLNDEFINMYTSDEKYAYIKKLAKRLISTL